MANGKPRKTTKRVALTEARVRAIAPPPQRAYIRDARMPGLLLCVHPSGARIWELYRRVNGRPMRLKIGTWPQVTVETARRVAAKLHGQIAEGGDPSEQRRAARGEPTVADVWQSFYTKHVVPRLRGAAECKRLWDKLIAPAFKARPLSRLKLADVRDWHARIGAKTPHQANRALGVLSAALNFAMRDGWPGPNPCTHVRRYREHQRDRFLLADEMPKFLEAVRAEPADWQDFFVLLLLVGCRRSNLLAMRRKDVDIPHALWRISEADSKTGEPLVVILPPPAVAILERRAVEAEGEFVFPGTGTSGHLDDPKRPWGRIVQRAGLEGLRIHDLRRTLGSWATAGGASLPMVGKLLGHRSVAATAIYARLSLEPVREVANKAAGAIMRAALPAPTAEGQKSEGSENEA